MKKIKLIITSLVVALGLFAVIMPVNVSAGTAAANAACQGVGGTPDAAGNCTTPGENGITVSDVVRTTISILSFVVGFAAVIMIMIGGFKYITSNGDSAKVTSAKNTVMYALVGVVVAALAQVLVYFVFTKAVK